MKYDCESFSNEPYIRRVEKPWGYELHWVPDGFPYMGKLLHIKQDARLSLQVHDQKRESWFLVNGRAKVVWDNREGELIETELQKGMGYTCCLGQRHRLVGITDCDIIESSTPEIGNTLRLQDDYKRPDETEDLRNRPNRGWEAK